MLKQTANYSTALMILTSVHHVYGAYLYETPWRLHVLAFSIPIIILNWLVIYRLHSNRIAFYTFLLLNFTVTIVLIGLYEGVYNCTLSN